MRDENTRTNGRQICRNRLCGVMELREVNDLLARNQVFFLNHDSCVFQTHIQPKREFTGGIFSGSYSEGSKIYM